MSGKYGLGLLSEERAGKTAYAETVQETGRNGERAFLLVFHPHFPRLEPMILCSVFTDEWESFLSILPH